MAEKKCKRAIALRAQAKAPFLLLAEHLRLCQKKLCRPLHVFAVQGSAVRCGSQLCESDARLICLEVLDKSYAAAAELVSTDFLFAC